MSTTAVPQYKYVNLEIKGNYAIVYMKRNPVNAMNFELWNNLLESLDYLESQKNIRGAIYTTGLDKDIFTAGNDLTELHPAFTTKEKFAKFWRTSTTFLSRLYATRLATIAAIRGACPAGGTVLSLCCDYRIMTVSPDPQTVPHPRIGFNEVAIGLAVPPYFIELYVRMLGRSKAEYLLMTGDTLDSVQAFKLGLVNENCLKEKLMERAESVVKKFLKYPDGGRVATKLILREPCAKEWYNNIDNEINNSWRIFSDPEVIEVLGQTIASLSAKPAKKGPPAENTKSKL